MPWPLYIVVTPIEFVSTFILRPITLALRLLMNMVAGHMLLVLCFSATQFFIFTAGGLWSLFSIGTFAFGLAFTLFELLVAMLQAYVFTPALGRVHPAGAGRRTLSEPDSTVFKNMERKHTWTQHNLAEVSGNLAPSDTASQRSARPSAWASWWARRSSRSHASPSSRVGTGLMFLGIAFTEALAFIASPWHSSVP